MRLISLHSIGVLLSLSAWSLGQTAPSHPPDTPPPTTSPGTPATSPAAGPGAQPASMPAAGENIEAIKTYARGEYASAAKMLEPSYRAGKAGIQDRLILARAYLHLGRDDDALAVLKNVLESDRENPEANGLTGQLLLKAGKNEEALKCLEHAQRLKPEADVAGALGRCYYALGNIPKAKSSLAAALQQDIRDPSNSFLLGRIHLDRGSGTQAEKYLLMAQEAKMDSPELHRLLGKAYLLQRKTLGPVSARRVEGHRQAGDLIDGQVVLGPAPGQTGQYLLAGRFCALYEGLQLLKADANDPDGLYMTAEGWAAAGEPKRASDCLGRLTVKDRVRPEVCHLKARLLVAMKDFKRMENFLGQAQDTGVFDSRTVADYLCKAAAVLRSEGKRQDAIAMLRQAEKAQPVAEEVLRPLAALYVAVGDDKQAAQYYGRIVELFPDAADIDELNNTLKVLREKRGVKK